MGTDSYWPESSLSGLLELHLQNYEQDFREYWHLDAACSPPEISPEDWTLAKLLDRVGAHTLASARLLRLDPSLREYLKASRPWESPETAAAELAKYDITTDRAEIELAKQAVDKLVDGKGRLALVIRLLSGATLSERAAAYVDRMVQCYVWGFDSEVTIMARAVVEAALEERIADAQLAALQISPGKYGYNYAQRRDAAAKLAMVDSEVLAYMKEVRLAGNDAVHAAPGLHPPSIVTLAQTVLILRSLFPEPIVP